MARREYSFELKKSLAELFTNIICNGFNDNSEHTIRMTVTPGKGDFCICIEDNGIPVNPINFEISEMNRSVEECKIAGLGRGTDPFGWISTKRVTLHPNMASGVFPRPGF